MGAADIPPTSPSSAAPVSGLQIHPQHRKAVEHGADCLNCPLYGCKRGPVMGEIRRDPHLVAIGEAPGKHEIENGYPFAWRSGEELEAALREGKLSRDDCTITNVCLCQPPEEMTVYLKRLKRQNLREKKKVAEARKKREIYTPNYVKLPTECCHPRLVKDIEDSGFTIDSAKPRVVLAVGGHALAALGAVYGVPYKPSKSSDEPGKVKLVTILKQHGAPVILEPGHETPRGALASRHVIMASLHPAFAMRIAKQYKFIIRNDIKRACDIALNDGRVDWVDPTGDTWADGTPGDNRDYSSIADEIIAKLDLLATAKNVAVDIETDGIKTWRCRIRCVGLSGVVEGRGTAGSQDSKAVGSQGSKSFESQEFKSLESPNLSVIRLTVPIRWRNGEAFWQNKAAGVRVTNRLRELLNNSKLIFHNGLFDTAVLRRYKLLTGPWNKPWFDTMLASHASDWVDLPHDLGALGRRLFPVRMWKEDADAKDSGGVADDQSLHDYCIYDVDVTRQLAPLLQERLARVAATNQFELDTRIAPIAREMGTLGLLMHEGIRGELSRGLHRQIDMLLAQTKQQVAESVAATGKMDISKYEKMNPLSRQQVARWLFDELGYAPVVGTSGKEFKPGDEPGTSTPALIQLCDLGVSKEVFDAVDSLIKLRACDKLRSTYVDGAKTEPVANDLFNDDIRDIGDDVREASGWTVDREPAYYMPVSAFSRKEKKIVDVLKRRPLLSWMHPSWKIHATPSGRWGSSPNAQNIPSRAFGGLNLRTLFVAAPGHVFVGADMKQVELRIYALVAGDELLLEAFNKDIDAHAWNAAALFTEDYTYEGIKAKFNEFMLLKKVSPGKLKYIRNIAKRFVYLETYGGEEDKLLQVMRSSRDKATGTRDFPNLVGEDGRLQVERWHEAWHRLHPETKRWQQDRALAYRRNGYVKSIWSGRRRYFPGGPNKKNAICNHEIQASASDITNDAIMAIAEAIPFGKWSRWTGLVLNVHDYLAVQVPIENADETISLLKKVMPRSTPKMMFDVDQPKASWDWSGQD